MNVIIKPAMFLAFLLFGTMASWSVIGAFTEFEGALWLIKRLGGLVIVLCMCATTVTLMRTDWRWRKFRFKSTTTSDAKA